jgi:hypothetical protein
MMTRIGTTRVVGMSWQDQNVLQAGYDLLHCAAVFKTFCG